MLIPIFLFLKSTEDTSDDKETKTHSQKVKFGVPFISKDNTGTVQITLDSA